MTLLQALALALVLVLALYAVGLYSAALSFIWARVRGAHPKPAPRAPSAIPADAPIAVLVPARNEGAMALRVVQSLLDQDTLAPVAIHLLVADRGDDSWPYLQSAFDLPADDGLAATVLLHSAPATPSRGARSVAVSFTGFHPKADKLNWILPRLDTPRVAVLDCDHQAHPDWLRLSAERLVATGAHLVQARRHGLVADGLFSLWDSLHQHVGCELFNLAFGQRDLTVFLTGTTFLADTALLQRHLFSQTITEDIDLSYTLFMEGERIVAEPVGASDEEVSPDLYSFLARRRRWSAGHTEAFLSHLPRFRRAPLRLRDRVQFIFHGLHYLVGALVFALHFVVGLLFAQRLPPFAIALAVVLGIGAATAVARTQRMRGWRTRASEIVTLGGWYFPAALMLVNALLALLLADPARLALPLPDWVVAIGVFALLAPLVVLLVGLLGFGMLTPTTLLIVVLSYPIAFYLDLSGVLLGLTDYLAGRRMWQAVGRAARIRFPRTRVRPRPAVGPAGSASALAPLALLTGPAPALEAGAPPLVSAFALVEDPPAEAARAPRTVTGVALTPVISIPESWRPRAFLAFIVRTFAMALPRPKATVRTFVWLGLLAILSGLFVASRATRLAVADAACRPLGHDHDPWIVPPERIPGYCETPAPPDGSRWSRRRGSFEPLRDDPLAPPDPSLWSRLDTTFECNLARFAPGNVAPAEGGTAFTLRSEATTGTGGARAYSSGALATPDDPNQRYLYGRFETTLKAARGSGLISAFFLHRRDPWQEIDVEFLGRDTTHVLLNVYFNPGAPGDLYNYGYAGTPVLVDLGFDAAADFHRYAIEWDTDEIRWFVDDRLVHRRRAGRPTPIPHLPMRLHLNLWATCAESLAGPVDAAALPATAVFRDVHIARRTPSTLFGLWHLFDGLFSDGPDGPGPEPDAWQDHAEWLPPHPRD